MNIAIESRLKKDTANNPTGAKQHDMGLVPGSADDEGSNIIKESTCLKLSYDLKTGAAHNYDSNAMEHRIRQHVLKSELVDTCGSAVDSTFASIEVAC